MDCVEVWHVPLSLSAAQCRAAHARLDEAERTRAGKLVRPTDRIAYTAAHAALRTLLATHTGASPQRLRFSLGPAGKPQLESESLHFNLSHSGGHALIALSARAPVGIDLEVLEHAAQRAPALSDVFCLQERQEIAALPPGDRPLASYRCWTRKEAVLKAVGCGFQLAPAGVHVSTGTEARLLGSQYPAIDPAAWSLVALDEPHRWAGALAVAGSLPAVTWREWSWEALA